MTAIVLYGLRESLRRRMFLVVLLLTLGFLALYAYGVHAAFKDTQNFVGPGQENLDTDTVAGAIVFGLAMFATLFLGAVLSVFLTLNVVRGDAEAGLLLAAIQRRTRLLNEARKTLASLKVNPAAARWRLEIESELRQLATIDEEGKSEDTDNQLRAA